MRTTMSLKYKELEGGALQLDEEERASLALRLITTLDKGKDIHSEEVWINEAEKRYKEYKEGKIESVASEKVFRQAFKKLDE